MYVYFYLLVNRCAISGPPFLFVICPFLVILYLSLRVTIRFLSAFVSLVWAYISRFLACIHNPLSVRLDRSNRPLIHPSSQATADVIMKLVFVSFSFGVHESLDLTGNERTTVC